MIKFKHTALIIASLFTLTACGDSGEEEQDGPRDITNLDYTVDQVLEDIVKEEGAVDYYATDKMTINAQLTIKPGVVIAFEEPSGFDVSSGGALNVEGTSSNRVVFQERSAGKGWLGVLITSGLSQSIANLTIEDAGNSTFTLSEEPAALGFGLDTNPTKGSLNGLTILASKGVGLFVGGGSEFSSSQLNIKDSAQEHIIVEDYKQLGMLGADTKVEGGDKNHILVTAYRQTGADLEIALTGIPIHLVDDLLVSQDTTMTLKPGVELYFASQTKLEVVGTLKIEGSAQEQVKLGALNNEPGGWDGVWIRSAESNSISNAIITQGGGERFDFVDIAANIVVGDGVLANGKLSISDSVISASEGFGVHLEQLSSPSDFSAMNVTYEGNALGEVNTPTE